MVGQKDIVGTRRGEKYFARTSKMRRGGDVLRSGVIGARLGGPKCAAQEVDFGNRIGYSSTIYEITSLGLAGLPVLFWAAVFCRRFASRELF